MTRAERERVRDAVDRIRRAQAQLPLDRSRYRPWAAEKRRWRAKKKWRCVYCGDRIRDKRGRFEVGLTCAKHADLPSLDWRYGGTTGELIA